MSKKEETKKVESNNKIALFEGEEIRRVMFDGEWYYSIEDVVGALSESTNVKEYVKKLRQRDEELSKGWGQFVHPLPIMTKGGRQNINCANTESIFRIIQSIPSKNAEPFKRWLARVGKERIDEIEQPAKAIERGKGYYQTKGYTPEWIQTRTAGIDTRVSLTDALKESGITKGYEYAILTNEMYKSWSGFSASEYKEYKGLGKKESLRDNMSSMEVATTLFSETAARELIEKTGAKGFKETRTQIHIAGTIAREAVKRIEKETGKKVVTHKNMKELNSPEVQKQIAQESLPDKKELEEPLSDFNKKLKKGIEWNPKDHKK